MTVTSTAARASARAASNPPNPAPTITTFVRASAVNRRSENRGRLFLRLRPLQVFAQSRQDFDEVAGPMAKIELVHEDFVPGIAAGARRSRQAENKRGVGGAGGGAALDRRGADLAEGNLMEGGRESVH